MSKLASRAMNLFPGLILRSPLHPLMSGKYMIIHFTGRKSGRSYSTPVAYVQEGNRVLLSTDSPWWRNMVEPAPVRLHLRGRSVQGTASTCTTEESAAVLRKLVDAIPSYARPAELEKTDGRVTDDEIRRAVEDGRVGITVELENAT